MSILTGPGSARAAMDQDAWATQLAAHRRFAVSLVKTTPSRWHGITCACGGPSCGGALPSRINLNAHFNGAFALHAVIPEPLVIDSIMSAYPTRALFGDDMPRCQHTSRAGHKV